MCTYAAWQNSRMHEVSPRGLYISEDWEWDGGVSCVLEDESCQLGAPLRTTTIPIPFTRMHKDDGSGGGGIT